MLCVSVVVGISLVTQPPFLFGEDNTTRSQGAKNISSKDTGVIVDKRIVLHQKFL